MSNILPINFTNSHFHCKHYILLTICDTKLFHYVQCTCPIPSFAFHLFRLFSHHRAHLLCVLVPNVILFVYNFDYLSHPYTYTVHWCQQQLSVDSLQVVSWPHLRCVTWLTEVASLARTGVHISTWLHSVIRSRYSYARLYRIPLIQYVVFRVLLHDARILHHRS